MNVTVVYYGQARDMAGVEKDSVEVGATDTPADAVRKAIKARGENLQNILLTPEGTVRRSVLLSVNDDVADVDSDQAMNEGDQISVFTAVAGG